MSSLQGKKIILGVCGSIAAYKTPHLVRLLVKEGAEVKVVCTTASLQFVTALSLSTVSKNPVIHTFSAEDNWNNHVHLGRWADLFLIAPISCNTMSKIAHGNCDNLLMAAYLSAICPIALAPAMDEDMYLHPATQKNLKDISTFANHYILPVEEGELASGLMGKGRMQQPEYIVQWVVDFFKANQKLKDKKILITAGPTYEMIDPVRFIGNFSTGKMGIALAEEAAKEGAVVTLILGPTHLRPQHFPNLNLLLVQSAEDMYNRATEHFSLSDVAICSAAVADFKPKNKVTEKIKKQPGEENMTINLIKNPDILATLGHSKNQNQQVIGFALETQNELENAKLKLISKNADLIVLNSLNDNGAGFGGDTNKVTLVKKNSTKVLDLSSKVKIAQQILDELI